MSKILDNASSVIISLSTLLDVLFSTVLILSSLPRFLRSSWVSFLLNSTAFLLVIGLTPFNSQFLLEISRSDLGF